MPKTYGQEGIPRSIERGPVEAEFGMSMERNSLIIPRSIERGPVEANLREIG